MAMDYLDVDYFMEASSLIEVVQRLARGEGHHQVQVNLFQCQYLADKLTETGSFLKAKAEALKDIPSSDDIRRKALRHLHFTVKRAEKLLRGCCCEVEPSWVESAVTLGDIKEDIVDILLDLRWWTSMVDLATASVKRMSSGQKSEWELVKGAEEDFQILLNRLHTHSNDLDEAASKDKEQLLKRLQELQRSYRNGERNPQQDREHLLAAHVRSRLENTHLETVADEELNAYENSGIIGMGSFGAVMKVNWFGRNCAVKALKVLCKKEATTLSEFQHPHIVQFFRYWEAPFNGTLDDTQNGTPYGTPHGTPRGARPSDTRFTNATHNLAASGTRSTGSFDTSANLQSHILMELLPTDLQKHLKALATRVGSKRNHLGAPAASESMPQEVAIDVMLQVAKAMWHLNNKDVAHRDLKPSNVLVRSVSQDEVPELASRGYVRVKLGDFGLAKTEAMSSAPTMTLMVGTKMYAAPEVFDKETIPEKRFPRKADVWSFGIMFCEVLSGKAPFVSEEDIPISQLQAKIRKGLRPELPRNCPDYLKFCITHCWQKHPAYRPNFADVWRMVRFAQVRSFGLIQENHDLFTFRPRDRVVRRLHAPDRDPKPSSFWFLFWRITFLFARRRDPSNQVSPSFIRQRSRAGASMARSEDKPLGYLVNPVEPLDSTSDPKLDVIFFEGNVGRRKYLSCKDTWVQRGKPEVWWPRDWLPKDFNGDVRVLLLEYSISEAGVEGVVDELQRLLVFSDRWNRGYTWQRPIVLVGHSLGCVVIQQLVVALDQRVKSIGSLTDEFDIRNAKVSEAFLASLGGCFFYAPPCTGLVPSEELLKYVFGGLAYTLALFADLRSDSSTLKALSADFMQARSERVKLMALVEGFHTKGRPVVAPASTEEFERRGGKVEELEDSNHSDTCKPTNREHPAYRFLVEFIREVLNEQKAIQDMSGDKRPAATVS